MSAESTGSEILDNFRAISNKLKKRFLRKPNVTEACESFTALGQQCENSELPAYAGICWILASRCEGSIKNVSGETNCLVRAGRQFLQAEENDYQLGCPSPSNENLEATLGCYAHAATRYTKTSPFPVSLNLEIVDFLKRLNRNGDVEENLLNSIELCKGGNDLETKVFCLNLLASHYIETRMYVSALNTFSEIVETIEKLPVNGARSEVLLKCEICRVFLLLILKPAPQKLSPDLGRLLEKYTWSDSNDNTLKACAMTEKMFITLQSVVASCQSQDSSNLAHLETELSSYLGNDEKDLLRILTQI